MLVGVRTLFDIASGENKRKVAVKMLKNDDASSRQKFRQFQREAETANRFRHPNIVELLGVCLSRDLECMVFEFMYVHELREF